MLSGYEKYIKHKPDDVLSKLYVAAMDTYMLHWMGELDSTESKLLYFILHRTIRFGKVTEAIPLRHFREGIRDTRSGETVIAGVNIHHETISAGLGRLEQRLLISVSREDDGRTYGITTITLNLELYFAPVIVELCEKLDEITGKPMGKLATPRAKKYIEERENDDEGGCADIREGCAVSRMCKQHKVNIRNKSQKQNLATPDGIARVRRERPSFATAKEAIAATALMATERRKAMASKAEQGKVTHFVFKALWEEAMLRHYPSVPAIGITGPQWRNVKLYVAKMPNTMTMKEVVDHAVENWATIINVHMSGWKDVRSGRVADAPDAGFFMKNIKVFLQSLANVKASGTKLDKAIAAASDNTLEDENAKLRRQVAALSKEREKLASRDKQNQQIIQSMERGREQRREDRAPLSKSSLRPIEDD